jgi:hypothetical protein
MKQVRYKRRVTASARATDRLTRAADQPVGRGSDDTQV